MSSTARQALTVAAVAWAAVMLACLTGCYTSDPFAAAKDAAIAAADAKYPGTGGIVKGVIGGKDPLPPITWGPATDATGHAIVPPIKQRGEVERTWPTVEAYVASAGPASPATAPIAAGPTNPPAATAAPVAGQPAATVAGKIDQIANTPVGGGAK